MILRAVKRITNLRMARRSTTATAAIRRILCDAVDILQKCNYEMYNL